MTICTFRGCFLWGVFTLAVLSGVMPNCLAADSFPQVGDQAANFELQTLAGKQVNLKEVNAAGPVVVLVLRGYPGYQCPLCNRQVGSYLKAADKFQQAGAQLILVYPGPSQGLAERAKEFYADQTIPDHFHLVTDPDYKFTNAYHLRWDAERETAYPSTFVIDKEGKVIFAKVSKEHGGRTKPEEALEALQK